MAASAGIAARHDHLMRAAFLAGQCFAGPPEDGGRRAARPSAMVAWVVTCVGAAFLGGGAFLLLA